MVRSRYASILGAVGAVLIAGALAGCTPPPPDIPGPSQQRIDQFTEQQLRSAWENITVPYDLKRPKVDAVRTITNDEYGEVIDDCLRGYSDQDYRNLYGYRRISQEPESEREGMLQGISWYVCLAQYPFDPAGSGLLSRAQLDYLYDYYRRWVVPCMVTNGHSPGAIPLRRTFVANGLAGNVWSPLDQMWGSGQFTEDDFDVLDARCNAYPDYLFHDS